jgi:hypothetical protein
MVRVEQDTGVTIDKIARTRLPQRQRKLLEQGSNSVDFRQKILIKSTHYFQSVG